MRHALVALALAGCYHDARPTPAPPANHAPSHLAYSDDVLAYLPIDSELVAGVEVTVLRESELFRHFETRITSSDSIRAKLDMLASCGVDPLHSLQRITIGGKLSVGEDFEGVIVVRGVDGPRALDCVARTAGNAGRITRDNEHVTIESDDNKDVSIALAGRSTLVGVFGANVTEKNTATVIAGGAPLRRSPAFLALYAHREPRASFWFMFNGSSPALHELRALGHSPKSLDGSVVITSDLTAVVRATFATPAEADQVVVAVTPFLAGGRALLSRLDLAAQGPVARVDANATEPQLEALLGMVSAMLLNFGP